jgi:pantetheine-phosphate adenylyltransferase
MDLPNVKVESYSGLLAEYAEKNHTEVIIRGLRAVSDFEYELQIAQTNHKISPSVDTIFLTTSLEYSYLSSSIVREVAAYGGDIHHFVPDFIAKKVYERAGEKANGNK